MNAAHVGNAHGLLHRSDNLWVIGQEEGCQNRDDQKDNNNLQQREPASGSRVPPGLGSARFQQKPFCSKTVSKPKPWSVAARAALIVLGVLDGRRVVRREGRADAGKIERGARTHKDLTRNDFVRDGVGWD